MDIHEEAIKLCVDYLHEKGICFDGVYVNSCIISGNADNRIVTEANLDLDMEEDKFRFSIVDSDDGIEEIKKVYATADKNETIYALYIATSMVYLKKIRQVISEGGVDERTTILFIGKKRKSDYKIGIDSRVRSITKDITVEHKSSEEKSEDKDKKITESVSGTVYSANLSDIVDIYDALGDELFKKNVRIEIKKDAFSVAQEIKETLKTAPEQFWFLNNGITIVTNYVIDQSKIDQIKLHFDEKEYFSIVNGAQTVSAAHDFFNNSDESLKEAQKTAKDARVLLRVVSVVNDGTAIIDSNESMTATISKSLNRQKPITSEDLAYYTSFVKKINQLYASCAEENGRATDDRLFAIVRRGEDEKYSNSEHSLPLVARAIRASGYNKNSDWVYEPWKAINTFNGDILKIDPETNDLKYKDIFRTNEIETIEGFLKYYQNVNLAIYLYNKYQSLRNTVDYEVIHNQSKMELLKSSGGWYFVTYYFIRERDKNGDSTSSDFLKNAETTMDDKTIVGWIKDFYKLMDDAKDSSRYSIKNLRRKNFYETMAKRIDNAKSTKKTDERVDDESSETYKHVKYDATMICKNGKYTLLKGSRINVFESQILQSKIHEYRNDSNKVGLNKELLEDIELDSLVVATRIVEGANIRESNCESKWKRVSDND